jgi:hypothetical protein
LKSFGTWLEQLIAESTGKHGTGIVPIEGEPRRDPASYGDDRLFVELQLAGAVDRALERHGRALIEAGHPVIRVLWSDRYDLGEEVVKWELATAVAGMLLRVNPFDEPNVSQSKQMTKTLLARYIKEGRLPETTADVSDEAMAVYGTRESKARSVRECLCQFLRSAQPGEYLTVLTFLPRNQVLDRKSEALRNTLASRMSIATALQFGPRYLHSTGQLYKGGTNRGLFLLLTADETEDLPIPEEPYTFGILKQAQALGDFQAMQRLGRRILRVHLRGDIEAALSSLTRTLHEGQTLSTG